MKVEGDFLELLFESFGPALFASLDFQEAELVKLLNIKAMKAKRGASSIAGWYCSSKNISKTGFAKK